MRVVIVDSDLRNGRGTAATVEQVLSSADVLLYGDGDAALAGIAAHSPDVVIVAPSLGPAFVREAHAATEEPKYVGVVPSPDVEWSTRYVDAGAHLVVASPVDAFDVQMALRHRAGGVKP
ncbi:MAG: Response regulator receiver domain [Frankiaceae bacterium]|jgi:DNA-binding NarL/FixJ family response regulator|nr:Response regulator receiver domain [Frankiaceae bacterium]